MACPCQWSPFAVALSSKLQPNVACMSCCQCFCSESRPLRSCSCEIARDAINKKPGLLRKSACTTSLIDWRSGSVDWSDGMTLVSHVLCGKLGLCLFLRAMLPSANFSAMQCEARVWIIAPSHTVRLACSSCGGCKPALMTGLPSIELKPSR